MQKILHLGQKQWLSGISNSYQLPTGIWAKARGINPFVNPVPESNDIGVLQMGGDAYDITAASQSYSLDGVIRNDGGGAGHLYMIDSNGAMWDKNLADDLVPSQLRTSSTVVSPRNGMEIYQSTDGTKYMYYMRATSIGRWDFDGPTSGFVDDWDTGITSSQSHPTHFFKGAVYFGAANSIGKIYSIAGSGASTTTTGAGTLTFPADFTTTCFNDDGDYLIAGITKHITSPTIISDTRIIFWDTVSQNFNKEYTLPDYGISSIIKYKDGFVAFGGQKIWYFNLGSQPKQLRTLKNQDTAIANSVGLFFNRAADRFSDAIIWGGNEPEISMLGSIVAEVPQSYSQPFQKTGGSSNSIWTFIKATGKFDRLYATSNGTSSFVYWKYSDAGAITQVTSPAETVYLDLGSDAHIQKIDFFLTKPLATGDALTLQYQLDETNAAATWGTLAYDATDPNPYRKRYELLLDGGAVGNQLKLLFNFTGGNIKIKEVVVYGDPITGTEDHNFWARRGYKGK